ncbi:geraniol 8-hydroxylase-like [Tasmannia lanceolata]|uniref:geraniol 8-hydroxylase-like n=1 Tax=Tasmannia lanceolata TaxID=3420 RepID=UPI004064AE8B
MAIWALLSWILFLLLCIHNLASFLSRTSDRRRLPPGPNGLPIIGSLFSIGKRPHESFAGLAKKFGPLMSLRMGFATVIVASSAKMAKEILQKKDKDFAGRIIPDAVTGEAHYDLSMAWISPGPCWRNLRKLCNTQMFTSQRLDALQGLRNQKMEELLKNIEPLSLSGEAVNISQLAFATALNFVSNAVFSVNLVDPLSEGAQEFKDVVWRIMEYAGKPNISDFFPLLKSLDPQGIRRHIKVSYDHLHRLIDDFIYQRLESRESGAPRKNDFLDVLLDHSQEDGSDFDLRYVKVLITDLYIAGGDTSATTVEWTMTELLRHPNTMKKVQRELQQVIGAEGSVEESHIPQLPYLEAVVKEAMRLHPPAPLLLPHRAETDVELCEYIIPKHTQVLVNVWAISRDADYWERPMNFMPERFLGSNADYRGQDFGFIPFGSGRRICPGMPLAVRMVHLMLASLLHSFNWKLPDGMKPETVDMDDKFGVTLQKAIPLLAIPSKRFDCGY